MRSHWGEATKGQFPPQKNTWFLLSVTFSFLRRMTNKNRASQSKRIFKKGDEHKRENDFLKSAGRVNKRCALQWPQAGTADRTVCSNSSNIHWKAEYNKLISINHIFLDNIMVWYSNAYYCICCYTIIYYNKLYKQYKQFTQNNDYFKLHFIIYHISSQCKLSHLISDGTSTWTEYIYIQFWGTCT